VCRRDNWWKGLSIQHFSSRDTERRLALYDVDSAHIGDAGIGGDVGAAHRLVADGIFTVSALLSAPAADGLEVPMGGMVRNALLVVRHAFVGLTLPKALEPPKPAADANTTDADGGADAKAVAPEGGAVSDVKDDGGSAGGVQPPADSGAAVPASTTTPADGGGQPAADAQGSAPGSLAATLAANGILRFEDITKALGAGGAAAAGAAAPAPAAQ
jgi:hypothetical protein